MSFRSGPTVTESHTPRSVFLRYQLLAVAAGDGTDDRTIGALFWTMCDEVADLRFIEAWHVLVESLRATLSDALHLTDGQLDQLVRVFFDRVPASLCQKLAISAWES